MQTRRKVIGLTLFALPAAVHGMAPNLPLRPPPRCDGKDDSETSASHSFISKKSHASIPIQLERQLGPFTNGSKILDQGRFLTKRKGKAGTGPWRRPVDRAPTLPRRSRSFEEIADVSSRFRRANLSSNSDGDLCKRHQSSL